MVERGADRSVFFILCLMLVAAPLAFGTVRPWSRSPLELFTLIALACWALRWSVARKVVWISTPLDLPLVVGMLYVVARYATSPVEWISRQEMMLVLMYGAVYFLTVHHLFRGGRQNILLWLLVVLATGIAAYGIVNRLRGIDMVWWLVNKDYPNRAFGTFYCPNHFAGYLELVLAITAAQLFWSGRSAAQRIVLAYGACVMLAGIVLSLSRGGYLSTAGMLVFLLAFVVRGISKRWQPVLVAVGAVLVCGVIGVFSFGSLYERFTSLQPHAGEPSRWWMWKAAWRMFLDYPCFGVGPFLYNTCYGPYRDVLDQCCPEHTHNDYLQTLADYGLVGFLLMGWLVGTLIASLRRNHQRWLLLASREEPRWHWPYWLEIDQAGRPAWMLGCASALVVYMIHSGVDFNLHITANALTLTVIIAMGMLADHSRHLSDVPADVEPRPAVVRNVELNSRARWIVVALLSLAVVGESMVVVPNYVAYLLQRQAEKLIQLPTAKPDSEPAEKPRDVTDLFAEARQSAERAWRWDNRSYLVARLLGDISLSQARLASGDPDRMAQQALAWHQQAEALNPIEAESASRQAAVLEFLRRWPEAEAAHRRALALEPNFFVYHQRLGRFLASRGEKAKAVAEFRRAVELEPADTFSKRKLESLTTPPAASR